MYLIGDIMVSEDVLQARFACDVPACKGACCWEGDYGAPLDPEEAETLRAILPALAPFLSPAGRKALEEQGAAIWYEDLGKDGTPLVDGGPCAYLTLDGQGIAHCGIEKAWEAGATDFRKPISCHLYPIRVAGGPDQGFEGLNYHEWSICQDACRRGEREDIPLIRFAREALIRRYGPEFYEALCAAADNLHPTPEGPVQP